MSSVLEAHGKTRAIDRGLVWYVDRGSTECRCYDHCNSLCACRSHSVTAGSCRTCIERRRPFLEQDNAAVRRFNMASCEGRVLRPSKEDPFASTPTELGHPTKTIAHVHCRPFTSQPIVCPTPGPGRPARYCCTFRRPAVLWRRVLSRHDAQAKALAAPRLNGALSRWLGRQGL